MKRYISLLGLLLLSLATFEATAQVDNGAFRMLTANNSARTAALGGLPLPMHDGDISTTLFNPSSICPSTNNQVAFSWVGDFNTATNFATAQYAHTFEKTGSFAASVQYLNHGEMTYTSESGNETGGTFDVSSYAVTLGWGRELTDKWSIGANLKYAGLQYESYRAGALAVDVAGTYWAYSNWAFTLAARNVGVQLYSDFESGSLKLPFRIDFVASKKLDHLPLTIVMGFKDIQRWNKYHADPNAEPDPITGIVPEATKTEIFFTNLASHLVLGGELELGKNLVLRASYDYEVHRNMKPVEARSLVGFSAGFGIKIKMFQIEYSRSRNNIVGSPNYLTLRIDLSKFK